MKHPQLVIGEIDQWSMVMLYDRRSGEIAHVHESVTWKGGAHPDRRTLESDARDAHRHSQPTRSVASKNLALLHVDPRKIQPGRQYRVDPKRHALVSMPTGKATRRRPQ